MKYAIVLITALVLAVTAAAEQKHGHGDKGPNGGPMEDVAGVHAELLRSGNTITINIFDEGNKPIATKGFTASALVVRGSVRETIKLAPAGKNSLRGEAKGSVAGATISVTLRTAAGKSGQARFRP